MPLATSSIESIVRPGFMMDRETLYELHQDIRPVAFEFERAAREALRIDDSDVEMLLTLELPAHLAGPAGKALRSIDTAWRLAFALAEIHESDLPD